MVRQPGGHPRAGRPPRAPTRAEDRAGRRGGSHVRDRDRSLAGRLTSLLTCSRRGASVLANLEGPMRRVALLACAVTLALPGAAIAKDFASTALNIVPSGEWGDVPIPKGADVQAKMYDGLTPLFDHVTTRDLFKYYKSERLTAKGQGHLRTERPRKGVRIVRDRYDVPHIFAKTDDLLTWATGWVVAEDRHLLLDEARGATRIAALDVPGVNAFSLVTGLKTFVPSAQAESMVARQTTALKHAGKNGREVLHNIDIYVQGVNAWYKQAGTPANPPWNRNDIYATNALAGQLFGRGGGNEVNSAMLLSG